MRFSFCLVAGFAVAACQAAPPPSPGGGPLSHLVLAPVAVEAVAVELSGVQIARPDWEQASAIHLEAALLEELAGSGTQVARGAPGDFGAVLVLAEAVLPEASAASTLPTASGPAHWSLGPLPHAGETALVVVHRAFHTTSGHRIAEIGLGLAFANPLMPDRGDSISHMALVNGGSGVVEWVTTVEGGDARTKEGAREIARRLLARIEGRTP